MYNHGKKNRYPQKITIFKTVCIFVTAQCFVKSNKVQERALNMLLNKHLLVEIDGISTNIQPLLKIVIFWGWRFFFPDCTLKKCSIESFVH